MTTTTVMMMMNRITVESKCFLVTAKRCYALLIIRQQNKHGMSTQPVMYRLYTYNFQTHHYETLT